MGTVLRVLVVIILIMSGAALFLAHQLYDKREQLILRTHLLEEQIQKVAGTLEVADPAAGAKPGATCPTLKLDTDEKRRQIRQLYQVKTVNGKQEKQKDPVNPAEYSTKGPGTMRELLDQVLDCAVKQRDALTKTRDEALKLNTKLSETVAECNKAKQESQADKAALEDKNKEVDKLKDDSKALESKLTGLSDEKKKLADEVADLKKDIETKLASITDLEKKSKEKRPEALKTPEKVTVAQAEAFQGAPGDKGKIVAVDDSLKFVVVELSAAAMTELVGEQHDRPMPQVDMMVRRLNGKTAADKFVARIKFRQIVRQKNLVVADILMDWQQGPVEINDVVFF